jgi:hypothetical protein
VAVKPDKKPPENTPGWFGGGDPVNGKKATMVIVDWLNTIQAELKNVIEGADIELDRGVDNQLLLAIKALAKVVINTDPEVNISSIPVGTIIAYYGPVSPDGFLACDGAPFDTVTYKKLYGLLGSALTPDLRGCFLRGTGGEKSAALGVKQQDAGRNLAGGVFSGVGVTTMVSGNGVAIQGTGPFSVEYKGYKGGSVFATNNLYNFYFDASRVYGAEHTASEFRPINMSILYCIKHD